MTRMRRAMGLNEVRHVEMKEIVMNDVNAATAKAKLDELTSLCNTYMQKNKAKQGYISFWLNGYDRDALEVLADTVDETVEYLSNSQDKLVINKLSDYPVIKNIWIYNPTSDRRIAIAALVLFPVGLPLWWFGRKYRTELIDELRKTVKINCQIEEMIIKE